MTKGIASNRESVPKCRQRCKIVVSGSNVSEKKYVAFKQNTMHLQPVFETIKGHNPGFKLTSKTQHFDPVQCITNEKLPDLAQKWLLTGLQIDDVIDPISGNVSQNLIVHHLTLNILKTGIRPEGITSMNNITLEMSIHDVEAENRHVMFLLLHVNEEAFAPRLIGEEVVEGKMEEMNGCARFHRTNQ
jgi:hypothetical protein